MNRDVSDCLIIFTRYPQPGRVKTRLIPKLGEVGAATLHQRMTEHTLGIAAKARLLMPELEVTLRVEGGTQSLMRRLYGTEWTFAEQGDGDLGARLNRAAFDAFAAGHARVAIIGSDCPELTSHLLQSAFEALRSVDVVIGPAVDGGYYLIGMRQSTPALFERIPWSTGGVLERTIHEARQLALRVSLLPTLSDVDTPDDLVVWERVISARSTSM